MKWGRKQYGRLGLGLLIMAAVLFWSWVIYLIFFAPSIEQNYQDRYMQTLKRDDRLQRDVNHILAAKDLKLTAKVSNIQYTDVDFFETVPEAVYADVAYTRPDGKRLKGSLELKTKDNYHQYRRSEIKELYDMYDDGATDQLRQAYYLAYPSIVTKDELGIELDDERTLENEFSGTVTYEFWDTISSNYYLRLWSTGAFENLDQWSAQNLIREMTRHEKTTLFSADYELQPNVRTKVKTPKDLIHLMNREIYRDARSYPRKQWVNISVDYETADFKNEMRMEFDAKVDKNAHITRIKNKHQYKSKDYKTVKFKLNQNVGKKYQWDK